MRPPEFTGGNGPGAGRYGCADGRFNEAAGIHRRKLGAAAIGRAAPAWCFNEAAGIHRRKPPRLPEALKGRQAASMRPPEFTGGNSA